MGVRRARRHAFDLADGELRYIAGVLDKAIACGTPVVAARAGALPETAGPAATYGFCTDDPGAARNYTAFTNSQADFLGTWSLPPLAVGAPDPTTVDPRVSWVSSTEAASVAPVLIFAAPKRGMAIHINRLTR